MDRLAVVVALSAGACTAAFALVEAACIPDLPSAAAPEVDAAAESTAPPVPGCGDGIVQLSLGEQCDPGAGAQAGCSSSCQIECDGGFHWSSNDHCYGVASPGATNITEWGARCTGSSHVVTFASAAELGAVAGGLDAGAFWIGIYQNLAKFDSVSKLEPGWDPGCSGCFAQTPDPTQPLPGYDGGGQVCVEGFSDLDASWQQYPCNGGKRLDVICEREPVGRLSQPCGVIDGGECFDLRFTHGTKSYVYVRQSAPPAYAEQQCESLGGTLVVLKSRDEREQLWRELSLMSGAGLPTTIWIGLSQADGADWTWADDASVDAYAPPWADRQPRDGGGRAYLFQNNVTPVIVDETLAHAETTSLFLPYVCQVPPRDD